jgi:DNA-damage-inducible protein J
LATFAATLSLPLFEKIGINTTDAVNMFFHQVVLHNGLPFEVKIPQTKRQESNEQN